MQPIVYTGCLVVNTEIPLVSILIRPEGRMQPAGSCSLSIGLMASVFQSSSGLLAGCNSITSDHVGGCITLHDVSILIRPSGRMQLVLFHLGKKVLELLFQSSSGQKAGCNSRRMVRPPDGTSFQSSSGLLAGCNSGRGRAKLLSGWLGVSILIRPSGRMQPGKNVKDHIDGLGMVSILIRPSGRMQPI